MTKTFPETVAALYYIGNSIISGPTLNLLLEARRHLQYFYAEKSAESYLLYNSVETAIIKTYGVK